MALERIISGGQTGVDRAALDAALTAGFARDQCIHEKKPFIVLDASQISQERAVNAVRRFIDENEISILNVAGPRASGWNEGYQFALAVVGGVIR